MTKSSKSSQSSQSLLCDDSTLAELDWNMFLKSIKLSLPTEEDGIEWKQTVFSTYNELQSRKLCVEKEKRTRMLRKKIRRRERKKRKKQLRAALILQSFARRCFSRHSLRSLKRKASRDDPRGGETKRCKVASPTAEQLRAEELISGICGKCLSDHKVSQYEKTIMKKIDEAENESLKVAEAKILSHMINAERQGLSSAAEHFAAENAKSKRTHAKERKSISKCLKRTLLSDSQLKGKLNTLSLNALKEELKFRGLISSGVKSVLVERVDKYFRTTSTHCIEEDGDREMCGERTIREVVLSNSKLLKGDVLMKTILDVLHENTNVKVSTLRENRYYIFRVLDKIAGRSTSLTRGRKKSR
jgi:hypothetical protein